MITRPLDLAAKLHREPRSNDWLFFVNLGLIVLFFDLFGSRFVLVPSVPVRLPEIQGAVAEARTTTHTVTVSESGQIFVSTGSVDMKGFEKWLKDEIAAWRKRPNAADPVLGVNMDGGVEMRELGRISTAAYHAGFRDVRIAAVEPKAATQNR